MKDVIEHAKREKIALFLTSFFLYSVIIPFYHIPLFTDGINPLALGFNIRGDNWSQYLISDGYYYKYGQLLFYLPFIVFIKNNIILYRILLVVNAVIESFIPICVYDILVRFLKSKRYPINYAIAMLVGLFPALTLNGKFSWAEPILMFLPWIILLVLLKSMDGSIKTSKRWIYSFLLAILQIYAYMVHTRGIVILIATVICVLFIRVVLKNKNIKWWIYFGVSVCGLVVDKIISNQFRNILYGGKDNLSGGTIDFINKEFFLNLFSVSGMKIWGEEMLGWLFASICSSFGLVSIGLVACIIILLSYKEWEKYSNHEIIIILFSTLCFIGSLVLGTIFFFNDIYEVETVEIANRGDKLIYVRYLDAASVCISFIGVYYLLIKNELWTKMRIFYAIVFFFLLQGFFLSVISSRIDNTVTWAHILMTLNYFCDLNQCIRGGLYSAVDFLSGGIALFGLVSLGIFVFAIFHRRKTKLFFLIYYSAFLLAYFWNAHNVIYRMDSYVMTVVRSYSDIIRSIDSKKDVTNIYLDDEILRCGFQYYFSDYYVVTQRDDHRCDIQNMFIISPKGTYNEELYNDDYFEIIDEKNNDDYHIYIKGNNLNKYLCENGYKTYKIDSMELGQKVEIE